MADHYDIKFKILSKYDEVCKEIKEGSQTENLEYVILNIHDNRRGMLLSDPSSENDNWISEYSKNLPKCFSWPNPKGKIILISCHTGEPSELGPKDNIAGLISELAKKTVIAPIDSCCTSCTEITSKEPLEIYEDTRKLYEKLYKNPENKFKEFK